MLEHFLLCKQGLVNADEHINRKQRCDFALSVVVKAPRCACRAFGDRTCSQLLTSTTDRGPESVVTKRTSCCPLQEFFASVVTQSLGSPVHAAVLAKAARREAPEALQCFHFIPVPILRKTSRFLRMLET